MDMQHTPGFRPGSLDDMTDFEIAVNCEWRRFIRDAVPQGWPIEACIFAWERALIAGTGHEADEQYAIKLRWVAVNTLNILNTPIEGE